MDKAPTPPERLIQYLRADQDTMDAVFEHNPKLRELATHSAAHSLQLRHLHGGGLSDELLLSTTSDAFTATMLLASMYTTAERVMLVATLGEALLAESATSFVERARSMVDRIPHEELPRYVRAQMDVHILVCYGKQMREPEKHILALALQLTGNQFTAETATRTAMQHHSFSNTKMH